MIIPLGMCSLYADDTIILGDNSKDTGGIEWDIYIYNMGFVQEKEILQILQIMIYSLWGKRRFRIYVGAPHPRGL